MTDRIFGAEKPDLNDIQHHGIKGQKWGVTRSVKQLGSNVNERDNSITKARSELDSKAANYRAVKKNVYKPAKKQYKIDKRTMGRKAAKEVLNKHGKTPLKEAWADYSKTYDRALENTSTEYVTSKIREVAADRKRTRS